MSHTPAVIIVWQRQDVPDQYRQYLPDEAEWVALVPAEMRDVVNRLFMYPTEGYLLGDDILVCGAFLRGWQEAFPLDTP